MIIVVGSPGVSYPSVDFGLTIDEEIPFEAKALSPLGQRQQFLIGSEFRTRYVDESKTLLADYYVPTTYMQTSFHESSILSMQAQMMGLYPSSTVNDLTAWQQGNAVPPLEGVDFSEWQEELGASALPYGLNVFPIQ